MMLEMWLPYTENVAASDYNGSSDFADQALIFCRVTRRARNELFVAVTASTNDTETVAARTVQKKDFVNQNTIVLLKSILQQMLIFWQQQKHCKGIVLHSWGLQKSYVGDG